MTAFLAADPNDSRAEGKLKLALEGLGFSVLMQPFVLGLRALRAARAAKATAETRTSAATDLPEEPKKIGGPWHSRPDWLSLNRDRLRQEIEDERGLKKWNAVAEAPGQRFNAQFMEGYRARNKGNLNAREPHPPYDETVPSYTGQVGTGGRVFVRVFPKDGSGPGRWLMSPELFEKIRELPNARKILKDVLALEREPEFFTVVTIPEGTGIRFGGVNAHPSWGRGGILQFEIMDKWKDDWFSEPQRIK